MSGSEVTVVALFSFVAGLLIFSILNSAFSSSQLYGCKQATGLECEVRIVSVKQ